MFTSNLKRSLAALPVTAGLLAAAAPASAQIGPATIGLTTPPAGARVATSQMFEFSTFGGNELAAKGFKPGGNELPVTSLKADSNEVAVEGFKLADEPRKGVQPRQPTHGITMLDYDGTPEGTVGRSRRARQPRPRIARSDGNHSRPRQPRPRWRRH